jgi:hypothetical protein
VGGKTHASLLCSTCIADNFGPTIAFLEERDFRSNFAWRVVGIAGDCIRVESRP